MCHSAALALRCDPRGASLGRHFIVDQLLGWGLTDRDPGWSVLDAAELVASELLSNALMASHGEVTVDVEAHRHRVTIAVTDDSAASPHIQAFDTRSESGRGLAIVAALSERWGYSEFDGETKTVWAEFALPAGSALARGCRL